MNGCVIGWGYKARVAGSVCPSQKGDFRDKSTIFEHGQTLCGYFNPYIKIGARVKKIGTIPGFAHVWRTTSSILTPVSRGREDEV